MDRRTMNPRHCCDNCAKVYKQCSRTFYSGRRALSAGTEVVEHRDFADFHPFIVSRRNAVAHE
jgi:hypothetical protein